MSVKIIGVGGAGNSIIEYFSNTTNDLNLIAVNTDNQRLDELKIKNKFQFGNSKLGAGRVGESAVEMFYESPDTNESLFKIIESDDLVILIAGLGGGTGSGLTYKLCEEFKKRGNKVIVIGTLLFSIGDAVDNDPRGKENIKKYLPLINQNSDLTIKINSSKAIKNANLSLSIYDFFTSVYDSIAYLIKLINSNTNLNIAELKNLISTNKKYDYIEIDT